MTPEPTRRINLRADRSDHTLSIVRHKHGSRSWSVTLDPDEPLTYGYEEAATRLDDQSIKRLLHFLLTGEAPVADADLPDLPEVWR